jgi:hypothetical protein
MITESVHISQIKRWDWIKLGDHEASTVEYLAHNSISGYEYIVMHLSNGLSQFVADCFKVNRVVSM